VREVTGLTASRTTPTEGGFVPSLAAGLVASLAGWLIDDMLQPFFGMGVTLLVSAVASALVFYYARRWLQELRGR
jgi:uncharacterized membrane protein YeaQ/YmgE (transglycosylase-associated protein family)